MKYTYKPQKKLLGSSTFKMQKSGKFKYLSEILHLDPKKVIVGLIAKGRTIKNFNGFVQDV